MPLREYSNWGMRQTDSQEQVDPYRKYYFICEGAKTEKHYFKALIGYRKELGIHPQIDVRYLEKTGEDSNLSDPLKLVQFAIQKQPSFEYDDERDVLIVVFDADVFEYEKSNYGEVLKLARDYDFRLGVTNPSFELFLLLHIPGTYQTDIVPNEDKLLMHENLGQNSLMVRLFRARTGMNPKTNIRVGDLAKDVRIAIEQNAFINSDASNCKSAITCTLGSIIQEILNDSAE